MDKCGKEFSNPLATFIDHDFVATAVCCVLLVWFDLYDSSDTAHQEAKKKVDKARAEYEGTLNNVKGGITKNSRLDQRRLEGVSEAAHSECCMPTAFL